MNLIVQKLDRVVPALSAEERENCVEEFVPLQLALGRVQSALEKTKKDVTPLKQRYDAVIESTEKFLDINIIMASIPELPSLSSAMKDAYPYRILPKEMGTKLLLSIENLANINERINSLLTLLAATTNDNQRRRYERIGRLIAILALLLTLSKVDIPSILRTISTSSAAQIYLAVIGIMLLVLFFVFCLRYNWYNWLKRKIYRYIDRYEARRKSINFHKCVQEFWKLAIYTTYSYKTEKGCKDSPALDLSLPAKFKERWNNGAEVDKIDSDATTILQGLLSKLKESPSTGEDIVRNARRFIYIFVLYPELIPLPRTLCILRHKSLQYIGAPAIRNNDFRDSLMCARFTREQADTLQSWLDQPENSQWIRDRDNSVETVASALQKAGVTANPSPNVECKWQKSQLLRTFLKESH